MAELLWYEPLSMLVKNAILQTIYFSLRYVVFSNFNLYNDETF